MKKALCLLSVPQFVNLAAGILISIILFGVTADAADSPIWLEDAQKIAAREGFKLISPEELKELIDSGKEFVLLDARPKYEFAAGSLPGAVNLEFHRGEARNPDPGKLNTLAGLIGPDKDRTLVTVCRSFR